MYEKSKLMTAGEIAKKMNCTVRTVQYYDQIGLLHPTSYTDGKRRLYSMKDYVILHQIIGLKELGFSLKEIKEKIIPADSIEQINEFLTIQEKSIKAQIKKLKKDHEIISKFKKETNAINKVDWELFIEILAFLRSDDEHYWIVKYFDSDVLSRLKGRISMEKGKQYIENIIKLCEETEDLKRQNIPPSSPKGQDLAKRWWDEILDFTGGDMEMISQMSKMREDKDEGNIKFMKKFRPVEDYINNALEKYFENR